MLSIEREINDLKAKNATLLDTLAQVRELIEGYVDVTDGDYGQPCANRAMRAVQLIDDTILQFSP